MSELDTIARVICDSEPFMWLMVGANHPESHLEALRKAYAKYVAEGGGYGKRR